MLEIEQFPELVRPYNLNPMAGPTGVYNEFTSPQVAHDHFTHALRVRGYRPVPNKVWVKDGYPAVMLP